MSFVMRKPWNAEDLTGAIQRGVEQALERAAQREVAASMVDATRRLEDREVSLREVLAKGRNAVADAFLGSLETRDRATQKSCRRIAALAHELGVTLGLHDEALADLSHGALLHNIGKIGIPDAILLKPGALDEQEWEVMRTHPTIGAQLLDGIRGMEGVRRIVLEHHERWDGQGYPAGLSGVDVCVGARILAVVDAFDAILSDRPYRKGATYPVARDAILRGAGSQFDPDVVAAFLRVPDEVWGEIRREHLDLDAGTSLPAADESARREVACSIPAPARPMPLHGLRSGSGSVVAPQRVAALARPQIPSASRVK
jgi:HD-GYP domain-containing protein (c-di-GMP phosphodiesterase class II)